LAVSPWTDARDGTVLAAGMQLTIQLSIAISPQRIARALEKGGMTNAHDVTPGARRATWRR
jgi:hypothetical protein